MIGKSLLGVGIVGLIISFFMYGDIGIAAAIGSIVGILAGVGFQKQNI